MPRGKPRAPAVVAVTVYRATDGSEHRTHRDAAERNRICAIVQMLADAFAREAPPEAGVGTEPLAFIAERFNVTPRTPKAEDDAP